MGLYTGKCRTIHRPQVSCHAMQSFAKLWANKNSLLIENAGHPYYPELICLLPFTFLPFTSACAMETFGCEMSCTWSSYSPNLCCVDTFFGSGLQLLYLFINTKATGTLPVHFKLLFQNKWSEAEIWDLSHQHPGDSWLPPVPGVPQQVLLTALSAGPCSHFTGTQLDHEMQPAGSALSSSLDSLCHCNASQSPPHPRAVGLKERELRQGAQGLPEVQVGVQLWLAASLIFPQDSHSTTAQPHLNGGISQTQKNPWDLLKLLIDLP